MSLELDKIVHKPHPEYGNTLYPVLVYRPNDKHEAFRIEKIIKKKMKKGKLTDEMYQELLSSIQCALVGLLGKDGNLYNNYGEIVGKPQPGDRFSLNAAWQDVMYSGFPKG